MLRRLSRFLVFAIEATLPMHARPPQSVRRHPVRFGSITGASHPGRGRPVRHSAPIAVLALLLSLSAPARAGGFGAGSGASGIGGFGSAPDLGVGGVVAVQQLHGQAALAVSERDCRARHRSFLSRTTLSPSQRKRQLAACLDLARAAERVDVAQQGD